MEPPAAIAATRGMAPERFQAALLAANGLDAPGRFSRWVLQAGMGFGQMDTWWNGAKPRPRPHEGLDLCLYRDGGGRVHRLEAGSRVPVPADAVLLAVMDDFLGESLVLVHDVQRPDGRRLGTVFGHVERQSGLAVGDRLAAGAVAGRLARAPAGKGPGPHLHITCGWLAPGIDAGRLSWATILAGGRLELVDPLAVFHLDVEIQDRAAAGGGQKEPE